MSSEKWRPCIGLVAVAAALSLGGCAQPKGVIFEPLETPLAWPPPPQPARIAYVGELVTDRDLKPGRSFGAAIGAGLFGDEPDHSMLSPYAVCTDGGERVFVGDSNAQLVHVFDLGARTYERWSGDERTTFAQPLGVAWDPRGRLLVCDAAGGRIVVLGDGGSVLGTIGDGDVQRPCGIAYDAAGERFFVADPAAHEVVVLDADGIVMRRLGGRGVEPGRFNYPTNVTLDDAGNLYVADTLNFRVQVFDRDLSPIRQVGSLGNRPGYFSQPKGIAVDGDGHLYVVDAHFEAVQIFDAEGRLLLTFGGEGSGPGEFSLPAGVHIDSSDRIWIADAYNRRVQVFQYMGERDR